MRICHGLAGQVLEVDDQELEWRFPVDVVRLHVRNRWDVEADDLILLASGGDVLGPNIRSEVFGRCRDVFVFFRSSLDPKAAPVPSHLVVEPQGHDAKAAEQVSADSINDPLQPSGALGAADPAFSAFRGNIAEARRQLAESRPLVSLASSAEARQKVQRLAGQAVLDNLASQRATCTRSMSLFLQKYDRVQEQFDHNLSKVEASLAALTNVALHPALRATGRESLADVVPRERVLQYAASVRGERAQLARRLAKLRQQDSHTQALCEQIAKTLQQVLQDDAVVAAAQAIQQEHARAESELLPALCGLVPQEGAAPASVLEDEKRSASMLEGLARACSGMRDLLSELQASWERRQHSFMQRLREVAYIQSKVRNVERQAALLEEEINVQRNYSQVFGKLQRLPKAYHKALCEIARRRDFKTRYAAQGDHARGILARMMEEENVRRRVFQQRYGCQLPADLFSSLGSIAPATAVTVSEFDVALPNIDFASLLQAADLSSGADAARHQVPPGGTGLPSRGSGATGSGSCRSSLGSSGGGGPGGGSGGGGGSSGVTSQSTVPGGSGSQSLPPGGSGPASGSRLSGSGGASSSMPPEEEPRAMGSSDGS